MSRLVLYIAVSLDGFIATESTSDDPGGVAWLEPYADALDGFPEFFASIGSVIMGRSTYEFARSQEWVYRSMPVYVLTTRPLENPPSLHTHAFNGDGRGLLGRVREQTSQDIWLVGGGRTIAGFVDRDLIDVYRLFIIPTLLHSGVRLFPVAEPGRAAPMSLRFVRTHVFKSGVVELRHERDIPAP